MSKFLQYIKKIALANYCSLIIAEQPHKKFFCRKCHEKEQKQENEVRELRNEDIEKKLQESYKKQRIALCIGVIAAMGSAVCTIAMIIYQISCL